MDGLLVVSIVLLGLGVWSFKNNQAKIANGITVKAKVMGMEEGRSFQKVYYTPILQFTTRQGEVITTKLDMSGGSSDYSTGDEIEVMYLPEDPSVVMSNNWFMKYGLPLVFFAMGIICMAIVIYG